MNNINNNVFCGMSGGVDSSASALLLQNLGYNVVGATMVLHNESTKDKEESDILAAKKICDKLNIPHYVLNLKDEFKKFVINDFIDKYKNGLTPNPCIECNRNLKFGLMFDFAKVYNCEKIATGHYAKIEKCGDRYLLKKPKDLSKDQTYVLFMLTQEQLKNIAFPLGDYTKSEIRELTASLNFENAHAKDSQDICFIPNGNYVQFLNKENLFGENGNFLDLNKNVIGKHNGIINYTIGQRKGLNVSFGKPMYVIDKNSDENTITLGDNEDLFKTRVEVKNVSFTALEKFTNQLEVFARLRYNSKEAKAKLNQLDNGNFVLDFYEPQRAVTPGQYAVFYDGDICLGGGEIVR